MKLLKILYSYRDVRAILGILSLVGPISLILFLAVSLSRDWELGLRWGLACLIGGTGYYLLQWFIVERSCGPRIPGDY